MSVQSSSNPAGFALYARLALRTFFSGGSSEGRMNPRRFIRMIRFVPVFCLTQLWHRLCLRLDDLIFPGYREVAVREPIFVCGMPRCGTTLLHRVLAQDSATTSFQLWELLLAPSIVQRKFYRALGALDRACGGHVKRAVRARFIKAAGEMQRYHRLDLWEAEEDELVLLPHIASAFLLFPFPFHDLLKTLTRFDDAMPAQQRRHVMACYKGLVQRHLYVYGPEKRFLSKNPFMSAKVEAIRETFPDARVICNVRTPHEAVPSMLSLFRFMVGYFKTRTDTPRFVQDNLEIADYFYHHPLECLAEWPEDRYAFVRYPDLTLSLQETVEGLYERLGYTVKPAFRACLAELDGPTRAYRSDHEYSVEEFGLTPPEIAARYAQVFEAFEFEASPVPDREGRSPLPGKGPA